MILAFWLNQLTQSSWQYPYLQQHINSATICCCHLWNLKFYIVILLRWHSNLQSIMYNLYLLITFRNKDSVPWIHCAKIVPCQRQNPFCWFNNIVATTNTLLSCRAVTIDMWTKAKWHSTQAVYHTPLYKMLTYREYENILLLVLLIHLWDLLGK